MTGVRSAFVWNVSFCLCVCFWAIAHSGITPGTLGGGEPLGLKPELAISKSSALLAVLLL